VTPNRHGEVALWLAFERLDHAYLVRDDESVHRELELIERLRGEAADAILAADETVAASGLSLAARVIAKLGIAFDQLLQIPLVPATVRSTEPTGAVQGDVAVGDDVRRMLGADVEVSAVANGVELGVDLTGIDEQVEDRVRLFVDRDGELVSVELVAAMAGAGILSATLPWSGGLPEHLVVGIVAARGPSEARPD
jgi:hypothetical protein